MSKQAQLHPPAPDMILILPHPHNPSLGQHFAVSPSMGWGSLASSGHCHLASVKVSCPLCLKKSCSEQHNFCCKTTDS